jgi:hypothetical protein
MSRLTKALRQILGIKRRHRRAERLPDFFVCGAARSGTTSLWQYLRQHPDIFMPRVIEQKEPAYFSDIYGVNDWNFYLSLFAGAGTRKSVGEASGAYLTSPESAGRIRQKIPQARIIISLRNPVERAWSLFKWMRAHSYETIPDFAEALETEDKSRLGNTTFLRNNGEYYYNFLYYNSGLYYEQVKRFFDTFGRDRVHVQIFEEFIRTPLEHTQRIFSFLGVDPKFQPAIEKHNATEPGLWDEAVRAQLYARYRPEIARIETLLGRSLSKLWV